MNLYLSQGTTYWYRVRASEGTLNGDFSNVASARRSCAGGAVEPRRRGLSTSSIQLSWTDNSTSESGFRIERSTDGTNFLFVGSVGST
jgi:titin